MNTPFVWFDNIGSDRNATTDFLQKAFNWAPNNIGPMTFLTKDGSEMPFAATCDAMDGLSGWVPYIEVDDLAASTADAVKHGATIISADMQGPAGVATFITDPGGAPLAIWKRGENV